MRLQLESLNATASIVESMCYFNRKIRLSDLGIATFRVAINFHLTTTICYTMHTAVCNTNISKLLALLQSFSSRITLKTEQRVQLAGKGEMWKFFRLTYTIKYSVSIPYCPQKFSNARQNEWQPLVVCTGRQSIRVRVNSLSYLLLKEKQ